MKRMLIALVIAAGLGISAGAASADPGGYAPPGGPSAGNMPNFAQMGGPNTLLGAGDLPPGRGPDKYGLHPCIKRFFHIPPGGRCGLGGCAPGGHGGGGGYNWGAAGYGMGGPAYNPAGGVMQGTLAFPHQPFTRSPRDFFMLDLNK
jgi:hypothetical protein